MVGKRRLGRRFGWLWAAYGVSAFGTCLAFDAFPLLAILVLHTGPAAVSLLAAAGLAVGAAVAVPLGPWVEFRRKRPVMVAMDLVRCAALASVPAAYALGLLGFGQLLVVSVVVAAADITFTAASGACLKALVPPEDLLVANSRFESTNWTATVLGPPLGGAAIGLFGPVVTVAADAVSFLLSAAGIRAIGDAERQPGRGAAGRAGRRWVRTAGRRAGRRAEPGAAAGSQSGTAARSQSGTEPGTASGPDPSKASGTQPRTASRPAPGARPWAGDLLEGWRYILTHPDLRPLFFNTVLVNGLIMATSPLLAVLMLSRLGFAPWQYGLAFAAPCLGGLAGSRLAGRLVARFGRRRVLLTAGALRGCWSFGLAFIGPGPGGLVLVMAVEFGLITCMGVFSPVFAAYRLELTAQDRVARTLTAWSVTVKAAIAALTAVWGLLAGVTGPRTAIALAGLLMLATPALLPRRRPAVPAGAAPQRVTR